MICILTLLCACANTEKDATGTPEASKPPLTEVAQAETKPASAMPELPAEWELFDEEWGYYFYKGENSSPELPEYGIALSFPESWSGRLVFIRQQIDLDHVWLYVGNKNLSEAYWKEINPGKDNLYSAYGWADYIFVIQIINKQAVSSEMYDLYASSGAIFAETDQFIMLASADHDPEHDTFLTVRAMLIEKIGQEAFDKLRGDLIITDREQLREIIQIY